MHVAPGLGLDGAHTVGKLFSKKREIWRGILPPEVFSGYDPERDGDFRHDLCVSSVALYPRALRGEIALYATYTEPCAPSEG